MFLKVILRNILLIGVFLFVPGCYHNDDTPSGEPVGTDDSDESTDEPVGTDDSDESTDDTATIPETSTDVNNDTDTTRLLDTDTLLTWDTYEYDGSCELATTEAACEIAAAALPNITYMDDVRHSCWYISGLVQIGFVDGACAAGEETLDVCRHIMVGSYADYWPFEVPNCGEFADMPGYIQYNGNLYFGWMSQGGTNGLSPCTFESFDSGLVTAPPECACLCGVGQNVLQ